MEGRGGRPGAIVIEGLWVRLKAGERIRLRDAYQLRQLGIWPFNTSSVYETDAWGYVVSVGTPENTQPVDGDKVRSAFEARFGVPATYLDHVGKTEAGGSGCSLIPGLTSGNPE